jgi:hypothetical protein
VEQPAACPRASTRHRRGSVRRSWPDWTMPARSGLPALLGSSGAHLVVVHRTRTGRESSGVRLTDRAARASAERWALPGRPPGTRTPRRRSCAPGPGRLGARDAELLGRSRKGSPRGWSSRPAALLLGRIGRAAVRRPLLPPSRCRCCWSLAACGQVGHSFATGTRWVARRFACSTWNRLSVRPGALPRVPRGTPPAALRSSGDGPTAARSNGTARPTGAVAGPPGPRR